MKHHPTDEVLTSRCISQEKRSRGKLVVLGLALATLVLAGCTSIKPDENAYNPTTGFPAVGGGTAL